MRYKIKNIKLIEEFDNLNEIKLSLTYDQIKNFLSLSKNKRKELLMKLGKANIKSNDIESLYNNFFSDVNKPDIEVN